MLCNKPPAITVRTICNKHTNAQQFHAPFNHNVAQKSLLNLKIDPQSMQEMLKGMCTEASY